MGNDRNNEDFDFSSSCLVAFGITVLSEGRETTIGNYASAA